MHAHMHAHTHMRAHREISSQLSAPLQEHVMQPGGAGTTVSTLSVLDRNQYEGLFADVLISHELLEIGESIGEGRLNTNSQVHKLKQKPQCYYEY